MVIKQIPLQAAGRVIKLYNRYHYPKYAFSALL